MTTKKSPRQRLMAGWPKDAYARGLAELLKDADPGAQQRILNTVAADLHRVKFGGRLPGATGGDTNIIRAGLRDLLRSNPYAKPAAVTRAAADAIREFKALGKSQRHEHVKAAKADALKDLEPLHVFIRGRDLLESSTALRTQARKKKLVGAADPVDVFTLHVDFARSK
jgi:hypothetical protein